LAFRCEWGRESWNRSSPSGIEVERGLTKTVNPFFADSSDFAEITLMSPGDIVFLYTDGVYDGSDVQERQTLEAVMRENYSKSARDICNALLEQAKKGDEHRLQIGEEDQIDDKTVFIIKRE